MSDPYSSPRAAAPRPERESVDDVVRAWVRLAVVYNVALTLVTGGTAVFLAGPLFAKDHAGTLVVYAFLANSCFLAGPGTELVLRLFGATSPILRIGLFAGGTLFASALAFATTVFLFQGASPEGF